MVIIYPDGEPVGKILDHSRATSIMCANDRLSRKTDLILVGESRDNAYYYVTGSKSVIMHVEDDFCIFCDYMVSGIVIPKMLERNHYGVYQPQEDYRDWIKNSATSKLIGYDIKDCLALQCPKGQSLDHVGHTCDEREKNKHFSSNNINNGSHRIKIEIQDDVDLDWLINKIRQDDRDNGHGMFL
jgi:hypothetical protein